MIVFGLVLLPVLLLLLAFLQLIRHIVPPLRDPIGQVLQSVTCRVDSIELDVIEWIIEVENKVGCVFDYETRTEYCRKTQEPKEVVKAKNQSYVAYLGEPEPFAKLISAEAARHGYDQAQQRVSIGDGAPWIWNLSSLCFPTAQEVVDWHHATEHLWSAAKLAHELDAARLKRWVKRREDELWLGHVNGYH